MKKEKYVVIKQFKDLNDNNHLYKVGAKFPRGNKKVSQERLDELLGSNNRQGTPLIEKETKADK